ncbi:MAG: hypothetical protein Q7T87_02890 [Polaromonas sp.]|nr:hypothetical protein [Polaromonas sp.]
MKNLVENLPKVAVLLTVVTSIASLIHEWGFYQALGLQLHEIPFSAVDQFKTWLTLMPAMLGVFATLIFLSNVFFAVKKREQPLSAYDQTGNLWYRLPLRVRRQVQILAAVGTFTIAGTLLFRETPMMGVAYLWVALGIFLFHDELSDPEKNSSGYWIAIYAPVFCVALFHVGGRSAGLRISEAPDVLITRKFDPDKNDQISGKLLRTYERFILIAEKRNSFSLYSTADIVSIKFSVTQEPQNYPCVWFGTFCASEK